MRIAFVNTLYEHSSNNKNTVLLTGDLGFSVFEKYMESFPNQYVNMGVAEQNMTGVAAGLAYEGKVPVIYSIVPFVTMRNFEQIRDDICYPNLNVKIVGVGAGFSYGIYGYTHNGLEDVGILRPLPNMTILTPGDPLETRQLVQQALSYEGPVYIRLGKAGELTLHKENAKIVMGKGFSIQKGKDITILASGILLNRGLEVTRELEKNGYSVSLVSMHTIKPLDTDIILESARNTKAIFTLEEHTKIGGLGSAVAEVLAENAVSTIFKRIGTNDTINYAFGTQEYVRSQNNLSKEAIVAEILTLLK